MGKTCNQLIINAPLEFVFDETNDLSQWEKMFSEYSKVEVLDKTNNIITFRLTTFPNEKRVSWSWVSKRTIFKEEWRIEAIRIEPKNPFVRMEIYWNYKNVEDGKTLMIWKQNFEVSLQAPFTDKDAVEYINKNSKIQMEHVKEFIEMKWNNLQRRAS